MSTIDIGDRIWFQVPTAAGRVDVIIPADEMSFVDADVAATRIAAVLRAMFTPTDPRPSRPDPARIGPA